MRISREVERATGLTPDEFAERFERVDRPVVIAGGAAGFRATQSWSAEYLRGRIGGVTIRYKQSSTHQHPDFHQSSLAAMFACGSSSFAAFLDAIGSGSREERARRLFTGDEQFLLERRDGKISIDPDLAPLYDDVELPALVPRERLYTVWAWFSGLGVRTWLHYDNNGCHNLNAQILGQKTCLLFAPGEIDRLYPFPPEGPNPAHNCCAVDVEAPHLTSHPGFAEASAEQAVLEPGDLLFIPAWWIHSFCHLGDLNANVNFWWKPEHPRDNPVSRRQHAIDRAKASGSGA